VETTPAAAPAAPAPPRALRVAAASAPVGDPALPRAMAGEALARRGEHFRVDAIEDRAAHLEPLLAEGLYAASLPWLKPDCGAADRTAETARLCAEAVWSAPLAEVAVSTLTRETPGGGSGLCAQAGLAPLAGAGARLEADPAACVAALVAGAVAAALVESRAADAAIAALGAAGALREDMGAFRVATLHAVALAGSADGAAALAALDAGLAGN
jgi:polar amino acid transport system substrate-binding protein